MKSFYNLLIDWPQHLRVLIQTLLVVPQIIRNLLEVRSQNDVSDLRLIVLHLVTHVNPQNFCNALWFFRLVLSVVLVMTAKSEQIHIIYVILSSELLIKFLPSACGVREGNVFILFVFPQAWGYLLILSWSHVVGVGWRAWYPQSCPPPSQDQDGKGTPSLVPPPPPIQHQDRWYPPSRRGVGTPSPGHAREDGMSSRCGQRVPQTGTGFDLLHHERYLL